MLGKTLLWKNLVYFVKKAVMLMTGFQLLPSLSELTHALDCEKIVLHSYHGVVRLVGPAAFPESVDYAG